MSMKNKAIYFLGSSLHIPKEALDKVSEIRNFDKVYEAFSGGVLPSDGYMAEFSVNDANDIPDIDRELSKIKNIRPRLFFAGPVMMGNIVKESKK